MLNLSNNEFNLRSVNWSNNERTKMSYNPAFTLKGISHKDVMNLYEEGHFEKITISNVSKSIKVKSIPVNLMTNFSRDQHSAIYLGESTKHISPLLISSNQRPFEIFVNGSQMEKAECDWCRREFDPIALKEEIGYEHFGMVVASNDSVFTDPNTGISRIVEIFWIYGVHCSTACALGELEAYHKLPPNTQDINCESSAIMTKILHSRLTGNENLDDIEPSQPWRLYRHNGGSIDFKDKHEYVNTGNIVLAPAKLIYERL